MVVLGTSAGTLSMRQAGSRWKAACGIHTGFFTDFDLLLALVENEELESVREISISSCLVPDVAVWYALVGVRVVIDEFGNAQDLRAFHLSDRWSRSWSRAREFALRRAARGAGCFYTRCDAFGRLPLPVARPTQHQGLTWARARQRRRHAFVRSQKTALPIGDYARTATATLIADNPTL
jgi:hypothetical protein